MRTPPRGHDCRGSDPWTAGGGLDKNRLMPNANCEFALKDGVLKFKEPARNLLSTWVQGIIVNAFVTPGQRHWKRTVASAIKRARGGSPWDPRDFYAVTLEFRFHASNHQNQELDVENYVKPVVDAVAAGLFLEAEKDPSEIQTWAFPDSNFRTLLIHRAPDPKDRSGEGVHVSVSVRRGQQNPASARGSDSGSLAGAATFVQRGAKHLRSAIGRWIAATSQQMADGDCFVTPGELKHCIEKHGAYRVMDSSAYHTDPDCIWGTKIKVKNLKCGFGTDRELCASCSPPRSWSPT